MTGTVPVLIPAQHLRDLTTGQRNYGLRNYCEETEVDKFKKNGFEYKGHGDGCERIYEKNGVEIRLNRCLGEVSAAKPCEGTSNTCKAGREVILKRYFLQHTYEKEIGVFMAKLSEKLNKRF